MITATREIKEMLFAANEEGRKNLAEHGIEHDPNSTTCDIVSDIAKIPPLKYIYSVEGLYQEVELPEGCELVFNIPKVESIRLFLYGASGIKKVTLKGKKDYGNGIGLNCEGAFQDCKSLEVIDITDFLFAPSNANYIISGATALKEIKGEIVGTLVTNGDSAFYKCLSLKEFRLKANSFAKFFAIPHSPLLSENTIRSIIDGLRATNETGTLMLHSDVVAKLTDAQLEAIANKNWTVR